MSLRVVLVSFASLFAAGSAFAQAPGEWQPTAAPGYAQPPPQVVAPVVAPPPVQRRWSIGVAVGQLELTSDGGYEDQRQTFDIGQLALRYRLRRHLEIELTLGGGHEYLEGGEEGEHAVATGTLAARYRFNPENKWNWWLLAGLGQTTVERRDASDEAIDAAARPHATFGAGVERRWDRFALQFEVRALATGPTKAEMDAEEFGGMAGSGLSGGTFSLGANYYF